MPSISMSDLFEWIKDALVWRARSNTPPRSPRLPETDPLRRDLNLTEAPKKTDWRDLPR